MSGTELLTANCTGLSRLRPPTSQGELWYLDKIPSYAIHDNRSIKGFFGPYRFLSNFYPSPVTYGGLTYPSVENAYQAQKFPAEERESFLGISAGRAKQFGQLSSDRIAEWRPKRVPLMEALVRDKFMQNAELRARLIATAPKYLEETNSWQDSCFGVCNGVGENNLGKILMKLRVELLGHRNLARSRFEEHFGKGRVFLPVIHLCAGLEGAQKAIATAVQAGADGVFLINQGMGVTGMLEVAGHIRSVYPDLWIGINPLGYSVSGAIRIVQAHGIQGLWLDYGGVDSMDPEETLKFRQEFAEAKRATGWNGLFFGGTAFKTSDEIPQDRLPEVGSEAALYMDVVTSSGSATNRPADLPKVTTLADAVRPVPLALASGIRPENASRYLPFVDAYLVASGIEDSLGVLNPQRTKELADLVHTENGGSRFSNDKRNM